MINLTLSLCMCVRACVRLNVYGICIVGTCGTVLEKEHPNDKQEN